MYSEKELVDIIKKTQQLLDQNTSICLYINTPLDIVTDIKMISDSDQVGMAFLYGAGHEEFSKKTDKWFKGRHFILSPKTINNFKYKKPIMFRRRDFNIFLILDTTQSVYMVPIFNIDRLLGVLVIESPKNDFQKAFSEQSQQILEVISDYLGLLIRKDSMVNDVIRSFQHKYHPRVIKFGLRFILEHMIISEDVEKIIKSLSETAEYWIEDFHINSILCRLNSGEKNVLKIKSVSLRKLIEEASERVLKKFNIPKDKSPYNLPTDQHLAYNVNCDPPVILAVLFELLNNSCKYREDKTPIKVEINVIKDKIQIVIKNKFSKKIPEIRRIFEVFYRLPQHSKTCIEGVGLGLWQVATLVQAHDGGSINIINPPPEIGFIITLPRNLDNKSNEKTEG